MTDYISQFKQKHCQECEYNMNCSPDRKKICMIAFIALHFKGDDKMNELPPIKENPQHQSTKFNSIPELLELLEEFFFNDKNVWTEGQVEIEKYISNFYLHEGIDEPVCAYVSRDVLKIEIQLNGNVRKTTIEKKVTTEEVEDWGKCVYSSGYLNSDPNKKCTKCLECEMDPNYNGGY